MKKLLAILIIITALFNIARAQEKPLVQFSGVVYNADSNSVVPYVTIINKTSRSAVFSTNYQGYFSFVAHEQDTLVFSSVGYRKEAIVIPQGVSNNRYTVLVKMKPEAINLPVVRVYPWASIDEFTREFMTMKFADDDLEIAKKNLGKDKLLASAKVLPRDAAELGTINFQNNHVALTNKNINMRGANPLFNPFAWSALIQQIMQGDKSRNNDND
ncbi:carboxypeptidase-like regulatory domain-containing protein (plasmid) [Pedobacter sp. BS3]|uniref:carboxypeptidase-like regulatory domain-containing protein n=1 Tax=Pedobacter sp. BS3 TaxID=2567937 RepID=UPI0011EFDE70|nr:carboxypeptidase-like regulatory domain-containing protein [Pedobacter sp. BS3]TZF85847.1 carboxypeptidase-like regulatory domain-containing protein [Pedobacter sp. BS3]